MRIVHWVIGSILLLVLALAGVGWFLAPQDPLVKADAIVAISGDEGDRLKTAIRLHKDGWAPLILFSGAAHDPQSPSNAQTMQREAVAAGIDASLILMEETSRSTFENARHSAQIIRQRRLKRIILVTSPYHQRRANLEFRRALPPEVQIVNHSAIDGEWRRSRWWLTPRGWFLTATETPKLVAGWLGLRLG
jgi:uncharacterized SAM-binding protein YcdF (DUF218 family)